MSDLAALLLALGFAVGMTALGLALIISREKADFALTTCVERVSEEIRHWTEVRGGFIRPPEPEVEEEPIESDAAEMEPIIQWLAQERLGGHLRDDVQGMFASLSGLRGDVDPATLRGYERRLSELGAPLPGMIGR